MMGNAYETFVYYTSKLLIRHMTSIILFLINATIQSESVSTDIDDFLYSRVFVAAAAVAAVLEGSYLM